MSPAPEDDDDVEPVHLNPSRGREDQHGHFATSRSAVTAWLAPAHRPCLPSHRSTPKSGPRTAHITAGSTTPRPCPVRTTYRNASTTARRGCFSGRPPVFRRQQRLDQRPLLITGIRRVPPSSPPSHEGSLTRSRCRRPSQERSVAARAGDGRAQAVQKRPEHRRGSMRIQVELRGPSGRLVQQVANVCSVTR
jgi:hypothetical protein